MNINDVILEISAGKLLGAAGLALAAGSAGAAYLHKKNRDAEDRETNIKRITGATNIAANAYGKGRDWGKTGNNMLGGVGQTVGRTVGGVNGAVRGTGRHIVNRMIGAAAARVIHGEDSIFNRAKKANTRAAFTGALDMASTAKGLM